MSEEEKEAIEHLKEEREYAWDGDIIEIALNLIDKLQKENEELKEDNKKLCAEISDLKELLGE